eukprot:CAMPEP_0172487548 /NCGR_PEP_ID=MMETSP1066-20121228/16697_1 /TAXON_ID=671091 /ORGANISM="Coscinodiscus wailesii, Strain CCMP2513" /LENGTH=486 /DNA_ID=CAMNT_0013254241 /DNA_START=73 /DNA_END=1533 /DNA_ORIENTATION=+
MGYAKGTRSEKQPLKGGIVINDAVIVEYTKGEKQPKKWHDPFFAVLYYIHLICIFGGAFVWGIPFLTNASAVDNDDYNSSADDNGEDLSYGILMTVVTSTLFAFLCGIVALAFMTKFSKLVIQASLLVSVALSLIAAVFAVSTGNVQGFYGGIVFALVSSCYACCVWSRIPFAAANLNVGLTAVKANCGTTIVAYLMTAWAIVYSIVWMLCAIATVTNTSTTVCDNGGNCESEANGGILFLLLVSYYWAAQVIANTILVTVAGTVGTWWFVPQEANSCCSQGLKESFSRASTYSFGSICCGSLLVAIIKTLRHMIENARNNRSEGGALLACIAECILGCIEGIIEYFNKWAFVYVGVWGYSYLEAGKNVVNLFKAKGFETIITDDLVNNALSMVCLVVGLLTGLVGMIPTLTDETSGSLMIGYFFIGFIVGLVISSIMLSVVGSSVDTVIVCFAEDPAVFKINHPELSQEMTEAWKEVYPELPMWN